MLARQTKNLKRQVRAINLKQAKSVGIIFNAGNPDNQKIVNQLMKDWPAENVRFAVVGFLPYPKMEHNYISDKTWNYFALKDCNYFMTPQSDHLVKFTETKHDLLLVLDTRFNFPIKWLVKKSRATFKAGISNIYQEELDFMIEMKGHSIAELIEFLKQYLGNLKTPELV